MNTASLITLLCLYLGVSHCTCAQDAEALHKRFLEAKAKAEKGDAKAQYSLGLYYEQGIATPKDFVEAVKWYLKAADHGDAEAQSNLGICYAKGQGVIKDDALAKKWFRKAALQNYTIAQANLGFCYYRGEGVERDLVEAYAWLGLAGRSLPEAIELQNKAVAVEMSPQQLVAGIKRMRELRKEIEARLNASSPKPSALR